MSYSRSGGMNSGTLRTLNMSLYNPIVRSRRATSAGLPCQSNSATLTDAKLILHLYFL